MSEEPQAPSPWQTPPPPGWPPPGWQPPPPPYGAPPEQATAGWHAVGGYPQPYGYPKPGNTNGFAIASLVCSLVGILVIFAGPVAGIVFGIVGLRQTSQRGEGGRGLAVAGIVVGVAVLLIDILGVIGIATSHSSDGGSTGVSV